MNIFNKLIIIFSLAISIFSFTSCSTEDDSETGTLMIDGVNYESMGYISQVKDYHSHVYTHAEIETTKGSCIELYIYAPISKLTAGSLLESFRIEYNDESTEIVQGQITIIDKGRHSLTIRIKDLVIKYRLYENNFVTHRIEGTATLNHSLFESNGVDHLPFPEN